MRVVGHVGLKDLSIVFKHFSEFHLVHLALSVKYLSKILFQSCVASVMVLFLGFSSKVLHLKSKNYCTKKNLRSVFC